MSGPKRNPDKLNTIGVVVVGICGAVLVYVTIVALQAFYMSDTSEIQTMADYGGNDTTARSIKTTQIRNITEYGANAPAKPGEPVTSYRISIDEAMKDVVEAAKVDPAMLVPTQGRADHPTVKAIPGRPQPLPMPAPAGDGTAPDGAAPDGAGAGSAGAGSAGAGSAAPAGAAPAGAGSAAPAGEPGAAAKGNGP